MVDITKLTNHGRFIDEILKFVERQLYIQKTAPIDEKKKNA